MNMTVLLKKYREIDAMSKKCVFFFCFKINFSGGCSKVNNSQACRIRNEGIIMYTVFIKKF